MQLQLKNLAKLRVYDVHEICVTPAIMAMETPVDGSAVSVGERGVDTPSDVTVVVLVTEKLL